jgi:hypothetical protein
VDQNTLSKSIEIEFNQEDFKVATERCDKLKKQVSDENSSSCMHQAS